MNLKLMVAIQSYKREVARNPDTWLSHCKNQKSLSEAIHYAVISENHLGKRHSHQYKLKKEDMLLFAERLKEQEGRIRRVESFAMLFRIVENTGNQIRGIGEMLIYDASERIGHYLNILPDRIYLHAGTRIGAEKLLGKIADKTIRKEQLPEPLSSPNLTCTEVEDILCMYKDKF